MDKLASNERKLGAISVALAKLQDQITKAENIAPVTITLISR